MNKLWLVIGALAVTCACGGGGGGGGGGGTPTPPALYVSISPSTQTGVDQGQTVKFTASVENDSSNAGVSWSVSGTGVTGAACGTLTNTTTSAATYNAPSPVSANLNITVTATSVADATKTSSAGVVVSPPPSITTTTLTNATPNMNYSATLQATGGVGTLTWSIASGTLPTGLSLSSSGAITGTPTVPVTSTFTVQVTDSSTAPGGAASAQAQLSLTVVTVLSISTTSLPAGAEGVAYHAGINASGGTPPYTWSLTPGPLPAGLTLQSSSGVISGTPTAPGSFTFTVAVQDSSPTRQTQTQSLTIVIGASGLLTITTTTLTNATPNASYSATLQATGGVGTLTWSLAGGTLPTGLSLGSSGAITGTPTVPGTSTFTVQVTDSSAAPGGPNTAQAQLSLTVVTVMGITTTSLPAGALDITYRAGINASGGTPPYTWSLTTGALPAGLTLQSNSGVISGTPTAPGSFTFTVGVQDSSPTKQTPTQSLTIVIPAPLPLSITTTTLTNATPNTNYSATLQATGGVGTLTWSMASGTLPTGLSLSSSGAITGTPTVPEISTFTVQVTDSSTAPGGPDTMQASLSLTVVTVLSISTTSLPAGAETFAYRAGINASGGTAPYTWSVTTGSLPAGLTLQSSTGVISGTPTAQGSFTFTVAAQDSSPTRQTQTQSLTLVMGAPGPLTITTTTLTNATPNTNYSAILQTTGGIGTLTWSLFSGALPTGLALSSSGTISGDPTVSGTATFTVQVTDSSTAPTGPDTAQTQLSLTVVTVMIITTASLPAGSQGITYLSEIDASGGTPPYTWTMTTGSLPAGLTMQPSSGVISGDPTAQGNFTFTVMARDSSPTQQSQSQSLTLAIGTPGPLAITTSALPDGTLNAPYYARVAAMGGTPPYTWSIVTGALPTSVSLNPSTGAISGTPPATGTADFTVMVTDASSTPESQTQELHIAVDNAAEACPSSGNNAVLSGPYAFSLSGFNAVGFLAVVGSFTADGTGKITAGEADTNGVLGPQSGNLITSASSYSVGPDNRGCATLATPFGTFVTHFALGSMSSNTATGGRIIEWDSPSASAYIAAGQLLRQNTGAFAGGLSGSYVFRTVGWDPFLNGRYACVGVMTASGNTFSNLEQDCNDAWTVSNATSPGPTGTYTSLDANGRGTGIIGLGESNFNITFYAVSGSQLLMANADPGPFAGGEWDQQNVPAGGAGFTQASLSGNLVLYLNGLSVLNTASAVSLQTATADGTSSMTINFYMDRAGVMQASNNYTCTYTVEPSGRVVLSSGTQSCGGAPPVLYLTDLNTGFIVDVSPGVDTGSFEPQSAGPFNNASLSGSFFGGMEEVAIQSIEAEVDPVAPDGSGNIIGTTEMSSMSAQDAGSAFLAATYSVNSDGTFSTSSSGGAVAGVIISNTKFVMFSPSTSATSYPTLLVMQK